MRSTTTITARGIEFPGAPDQTYQVTLDGRAVSSSSGHITPQTYPTDAEAVGAYVRLALARPSNSSFPHIDRGTWLEPTDDQGRSLGQLSTQAMREQRSTR